MPNNRRLTRKEQIAKNLADKGILVEEKHRPYRTILTKEKKSQYEFGVLGSSLVYGVFLQDAVVVSCSGGTLATMTEASVINEFTKRRVKKIAVMGGTNNLVLRDKTVTDPATIVPEMEKLLRTLMREGISCVLVQLPGREHRKKEIKDLNKKYEELAKTLKIPFHHTSKFTIGGLSGDGLHPRPEKVQALAKDLFDALKCLSQVPT